MLPHFHININLVPPQPHPQVTQFLEGPTLLLLPFNKEGVPTMYNGYLEEKFQSECQLHERFMIFFHMVRKKWRCWSFMYALLHSFLLCKENLCRNSHFFAAPL